MNWIDIASIVFICVTMNHLGLVAAVERVVKFDIPILNCPKCASFWFTAAYLVGTGVSEITHVLAVSFLAGYVALWGELLEAYLDTFYLRFYEKIMSNDCEHPTTSDADDGHT